MAGRDALGNRAQFVLVLLVGHPCQNSDFAKRQAAVAKSPGDLIDGGKCMADAEPLASGAHLRIDSLTDPMRTRRGLVERPFSGQVEFDQ
jgi:hypothetical protein